MTLPRFFSRVADAIAPVATLDRDALAAHLETVTVHIHHEGPDDLRHASLLAVNLAARLYPRVVLHGDQSWIADATELACGISPAIDIAASPDSDPPSDIPTTNPPRLHVHLRWNRAGSANTVGIAANGFNAYVDPPEIIETRTAHPLAAAVAIVLGMGEVFRVVFADALGDRGRRGPQPGSLNLITCASADEAITPTDGLLAELPPATLVGAGAVGQACLWALLAIGIKTTLTVVDPQTVDLSNLQRYLLTTDSSEGQSKTALVAAAVDASDISVVEVPTAWGADDRSGPGAGIVLTALDSAADRIAVAASLPGAAYNAWTQPADVGWSRHEQFGTEPCLACLYYPNQKRPNEHELIAAALRQHPLRVLTYLVTHVPVGAPLPHIVSIPDLNPPPDAQIWLSQPLLTSLVEQSLVSAEEANQWAAHPIGQLYRDGVCGGGLVRLPGAATSEAALVPLAHQSALAGIMLAAEYYVANQPALRPHRRATGEGRFDVLRGMPQLVGRPRELTPGCLCGDATYNDVAATLR